MKKNILLCNAAFLLVVFGSGGCKLLPPKTVDFVDLTRYAGLWYEIARYPTSFDENAVAVTATYTLNDNDTVRVLNQGRRDTLDGPATSIQGVARVVDEETNAKLAVTFDREEIKNFEFPYWIIALGAEYDYAVVSNPGKSVLYILSRTPAMDSQLYADIIGELKKQGFNTNKLELTAQPAL
jgi:apolipoprotein D and lipocalin family protein